MCDARETRPLRFMTAPLFFAVLLCYVLFFQHGITVVLLIPNEKRVVGIVVGRHGLRLKTILATSHSLITVEKCVPYVLQLPKNNWL